MHVYCFFAVHEPMFHGILGRLMQQKRISRCSGFVWGEQQADVLRSTPGPVYDPLTIFSRDVLPNAQGKPDFDFLTECEQKYGVSLNRVLLSERHLLDSRSFEERLRLMEVLIRTLERSFTGKNRPDLVLTEDVSCLTSYLHFIVARHHGIRFLSLGQGKLTKTVAIYGHPMQIWEHTDRVFARLRVTGISDAQRVRAQAYMDQVCRKGARPPSATVAGHLPKVNRREARRLFELTRRWTRDPGNPTLRSPWRAVASRAARWANAATTGSAFAQPVPGERYMLFPLQAQPEASTLVRAPMYVDQAALVEDISKALPVGLRLYVKEHYAGPGRRSASFYRRLSAVHGVRVIAPDADTLQLIRGATAVMTISSTMGFEAIMLERPVITFGEVFYNSFPLVAKAFLHPKDEWYAFISRFLRDFQADRALLLAYITAIQESLRPGFKANPYTFPEVLQEDNLENLAAAVASAMEDVELGTAMTSEPRSRLEAGRSGSHAVD